MEGAFTHLVDLLLQMLQLRVLLVDEGELGEVALLHWREAVPEGRTGQGERDVEKDDTDTSTQRQRETETERQRPRKPEGTQRKPEQVRVRERDGGKIKRDPETLRNAETQRKRGEGEKTPDVGREPRTRERTATSTRREKHRG